MRKLLAAAAAVGLAMAAGVAGTATATDDARIQQVSNLRINEVMTHGAMGAPAVVDPVDEFIEIVNLGPAFNLNTAGVRLTVCAGDGAEVATFDLVGTIGATPDNFFVIAHSGSSTAPMPDQVEDGLALDSNSGVLISNNIVGSIDAVGLGDHALTSPCIETAAAPSVASNLPNGIPQSTARDAVSTDTDVNSADFLLRIASPGMAN